ncbi:MAG: hypothetical protein DGJ47_000369 [Rickettsiaceae bacterium]
MMNHNKVLKHMHSNGIWNSLDIYKVQGDFLEIFHFGGTKESLDLINFYINNEDGFENFLMHFRNEFSDLLYKNVPLINIDNDIKNSIISSDNVVHKYEQYKQDLERIKFSKVFLYNKDLLIQLCKREWESVKLYSDGLSMKEIASKLGISSRTVEGYIIDAKRKMGLHSKNKIREVI